MLADFVAIVATSMNFGRGFTDIWLAQIFYELNVGHLFYNLIISNVSHRFSFFTLSFEFYENFPEYPSLRPTEKNL